MEYLCYSYYKLSILKLNGFKQFPTKLFTSASLRRDFVRDESSMCLDPSRIASAGVVP